jgi:hypothetical protein
MEVAEARELVEVVGGIEGSCRDQAVLTAAIGSVARLRAWLDGRDVELARQLSAVVAVPEDVIAGAARTSTRDATRVLARADTTGAVPALGGALAAGEVSGAHVDVVAAVLRSADPAARQALLDDGAWIAGRASVLSPGELRRELAAEVRLLEADDGRGRLARQRRACRLRSWVDAEGMWRFDARFDPETGLRLHNRITRATEQLFAQAVPDDAPDDPVERQSFLRARATISLLDGHDPTPGSGDAPEVIVVVDTTAPDPHGQPTIDWGLPVELPLDVLHRCFEQGEVACVVVRNGVVLHAPGCLELGRSSRLANRAQRRVLRALYPTCAIPGCATRFELCKIHHVIWWDHGGLTDLDNLLPICSTHHHRVHDDGWHLKLTPDRTLTITYPNGTTHTTGPPRRR